MRPGLVGGGCERQQRPRARGLLAGADDRDAVRDRAQHRVDERDVGHRDAVEAVGSARLERAQEHLLAGLAVEVVVGVPVAREGQGIGPVQLLVTRLHVDRREAGVLGLGEWVVVVLVDVHVDAAERVDELLESREVDVQEVVRVDAGDLLDRLQRLRVPALRVGRVDLVAEAGHPQVARDRKQRDHVVLRVHPRQHQRVGEAVLAGRAVGAVVGADQKRGDRLARRRDLGRQFGGRLLVDAGHLRHLVVDAVQVPQLIAARAQHDDHEQSDHRQRVARPAGYAAPPAATEPLGRLAAVDGHFDCAPGRISIARAVGRRLSGQSAPGSPRPVGRGNIRGGTGRRSIRRSIGAKVGDPLTHPLRSSPPSSALTWRTATMPDGGQSEFPLSPAARRSPGRGIGHALH